MARPMIIDEVSAELRAKATRLLAEMDLPSSYSPRTLLAVAFLDEVNSEYDSHLAKADPEHRAIYDRAIELSRHAHNLCLADQAERIITAGCPGQPPIVATVTARDRDGKPVDRKVTAVQYIMGDVKPLWWQYVIEASYQIDEERRKDNP